MTAQWWTLLIAVATLPFIAFNVRGLVRDYRRGRRTRRQLQLGASATVGGGLLMVVAAVLSAV